MDVNGAAEAVRALSGSHRAVLIALDGFGGAGKSTLARVLADQLGSAEVIALDDFIVKEHVLDDSWEFAWDRARLREQVLEPLVAGRQAAFQRLDWATNTLGASIQVPRADFVIVEGITTLHPELREHWDYSIWVETPVAVARERGRARDAGNENEGHWDLWSRNDVGYRAGYEPDRAADVVIAGD
ncbi:MAG: hypothetical protein ABIR17_01970 [Pseudolysinimonas sp.]|uniref:uridine kinase family protein n=1 Tax=Pseudolysinimonas sp. TaxID=2680009 RepID=UPI003267BDDA